MNKTELTEFKSQLDEVEKNYKPEFEDTDLGRDFYSLIQLEIIERNFYNDPNETYYVAINPYVALDMGLVYGGPHTLSDIKERLNTDGAVKKLESNVKNAVDNLTKTGFVFDGIHTGINASILCKIDFAKKLIEMCERRLQALAENRVEEIESIEKEIESFLKGNLAENSLPYALMNQDRPDFYYAGVSQRVDGDDYYSNDVVDYKDYITKVEGLGYKIGDVNTTGDNAMLEYFLGEIRDPKFYFMSVDVNLTNTKTYNGSKKLQ